LATLLMGVAPAKFPLVRLKVMNKDAEVVYIRLISGTTFYYLTANPGYNLYTIERKLYRATFFMCGRARGATIDATTGQRVTILPCGVRVTTRREPGYVKVWYAPPRPRIQIPRCR
jgi:hypothetical protein